MAINISEKNQFPDKGFTLSISQERATLDGLGEEICQKIGGFFNLRMSAFITFLLFCFFLIIIPKIVSV